MKIKILNLYAGIGGNREKWKNVDVTAVENKFDIAEIYSKKFPNDKVIIADAHKYLEIHYNEFDFIWSSPPCPSHSQWRHNVGVKSRGLTPVMPDMSLYSQIIFLQNYYKGKWIIENVRPYYTPLIEPSFKLQRHLFWANFEVKNRKFDTSKIRNKNKISDFEACKDVISSKIKNKRQVLRNMVNADLGLYILEQAIKRKEK